MAFLALAPATGLAHAGLQPALAAWDDEAAPGSCRHLYTSSWRADCTELATECTGRPTHAYPILLVKQDGSTIHIRYPEPLARMLKVSSS